MGNEVSSNMGQRSGYASVRTHRRNSSASLQAISSDMISTMIQQSKESKAKEEIKEEENIQKETLTSTSSLYRNTNTTDKDGNITIGSYCYCDCDTYYVVITEILGHNKYKIVDLFEQRARVSYTRNLQLIHDDAKLRIAQQQHKNYLLNVDRES